MPRIALGAAMIGAMLALCCGAAPSHAASPARFCARVGTDDTVRPIPRRLVPTATRIFGLSHMPPRQVRRSTYFRCLDSRLLLCNLGANLPCGKANTSRQLPGANGWCAAHPGADDIPAFVTGHDSIFRWHCDGAQAAVVGAPLFQIDARGFIAEFWKPAN